MVPFSGILFTMKLNYLMPPKRKKEKEKRKEKYFVIQEDEKLPSVFGGHLIYVNIAFRTLHVLLLLLSG